MGNYTKTSAQMNTDSTDPIAAVMGMARAPSDQRSSVPSVFIRGKVLGRAGYTIAGMRKPAFLLSLLLMPWLAGSVCLSQESSSHASRPAQSSPSRATPTPAPESRKRRSVAKVEDAMSKGEELLFKKHDAKSSIEEFKRAIKLDPFYAQGYLLLGLAQMQLGQWTDAQW